MIYRLLIFIIILMNINNCKAVIEYKNWAWHFPPGSNMGLYVAIAVPIEDPIANVFIAYNLEANYLLPGNESETVEYPVMVPPEDAEEARSSSSNDIINRMKVYQAIEHKLKSYNYSGRDCLLRIICEVSTTYFAHNGIIGDLVHILLTPSTSVNKGLPPVYENAEEYGKNNKNCKKYKKKCSKNFSDLLSWLVNM